MQIFIKTCQEMNFGSSFTWYECILFSKIYFADILSYIGITELACRFMSVDWSLYELQGC